MVDAAKLRPSPHRYNRLLQEPWLEQLPPTCDRLDQGDAAFLALAQSTVKKRATPLLTISRDTFYNVISIEFMALVVGVVGYLVKGRSVGLSLPGTILGACVFV